MASLKDKNNMLAVPLFWLDTSNGHKIWWDTAREYWLTFMQKINDYTDGNGKPRVAESEVENQICAQLPAWQCNGEVQNPFPPQAVVVGRTGGGCCGR